LSRRHSLGSKKNHCPKYIVVMALATLEIGIIFLAQMGVGMLGNISLLFFITSLCSLDKRSDS
jgi:hypothetical protein